MARILGLDIGSNSIGWSLIELNGEQSQIIGIGVRVFPEGVDRDKQGGEVAKNEARRMARGMRRQTHRRAIRKRLLRQSLIQAGLFPSDPEAAKALMDLNPYDLRARALVQPLKPFEIGRLLIHLNQRRGFLSNRKTDNAAENKKETEGILKEMGDLESRLNGQTLGQHLAAAHDKNPHDRIRGLHTKRSMFLQEFEQVWEAQRKHHPELLSEHTKYGTRGPQTYPAKPRLLPNRKSNSLLKEYGLHGIIFFQRPMYWPKSVIGVCELEPKEKRAWRADRRFQRFRMYQEVNNLEIITARGLRRSLTETERNTVLGLLSTRKEVTFDQLRDRMELEIGDVFNLERGDRKKLLGLQTDHLLAGKKFFGKSWADRPEPQQNAIVKSLLEDDADIVRTKALSEWGCSPELADTLVKTNLGDGRASLSIKAIEKLLPHLERGLHYMANDATDSALHAAGYIRPDEKVPRPCETLPMPPTDITNPLVRQGLFEVRKLINAIIREWGKPDKIHIELAREVQGSGEKRKKYIENMRERERRRDTAADEIRALGAKPTREGINRYLLWEEQGHVCLYSGRPISAVQLFAESAEIQVDHILPRPRSLDDSLMNKAVCFRDENDAKGNRTPHEWLAECDPAKYEAILQRAGKLPLDVRKSKLQKIAAKDIQLDDFINRQLTDTAYITTQVHKYVRKLGVDVVCTKGQSTAELRHLWGLDAILNSDDPKRKNRDDHRHHAVDALVIALTDRSRLQQLARYREIHSERLREAVGRKAFPAPWITFLDDARERTNSIWVSHRPSRRIRGALHEETIYGATSKPHRATTNGPRGHAKNWIEEAGVFVLRKKLEDLAPAEIEKIRDPRVRECVKARLAQHGLDADSAVRIPKTVWAEPLFLTIANNPAKSANPAVIKRVRLTKKDETIQPIRASRQVAFVKPGNTHHIALFELPGSTADKPKRAMIAVTMLEAARRVQNHEPLVQRKHPQYPEAKFLFSLSRGDGVEGKIQKRQDLYIFRTAASTTQQMQFFSHLDARPAASVKTKITATPNTLDARKVRVDILGHVHPAND